MVTGSGDPLEALPRRRKRLVISFVMNPNDLMTVDVERYTWSREGNVLSLTGVREDGLPPEMHIPYTSIVYWGELLT